MNNPGMFVGRSPAFNALLRAAGIVAATDVSVLLQGQSGTGKEMLAHYLHQHSPRCAHPFVVINCAALPEHLAESLLFGHRKGAFTGAIDHHPGSIRTADQGTLFLDEIGELPLGLQAKLLRFLQSGECLPVGEIHPVRVKVRIVAATHRDLLHQVRQGAFREDLFYRLNVVPLEVPALRERQEDIEDLLRFHLDELSRHHRLQAPRFSPAALRLLRDYAWPGNIRELRNFAERMLVLLPGQRIEAAQLPREFQRPTDVCDTAAASAFVLPADGISLEALEAQMIDQALRRTRGNQTRAARLLGLTRDTFLYRMKKHALIG